MKQRNPVTISTLRSNIYRMIDEVIEKGEPLVIERNGAILHVSVESRPASKLDRLKRRECIIGDPESLVDIGWEHELNLDGGDLS